MSVPHNTGPKRVPSSWSPLERVISEDSVVDEEQMQFPYRDFEETQDDYSKKQVELWDECVHRNMSNARDGYDRVGVLMVKWDDELDDLNCGEEVQRLAEVFEKKYHFEVHRLELHNKKKPQHQLSSAISDLVKEYDASSTSRNLMIMYYSGHGAWDPQLHHYFFEAQVLHESEKPNQSPHRPRVDWDDAEIPFRHSESDVFAIFDACLASNMLMKNTTPDHKTYEALAAASRPLTERPGSESFTHALTQVLEEQLIEILAPENLKSSFTTQFLTERICEIRHKNMPVKWNRLQYDHGPIRLAPVAPLNVTPTLGNPSSRKINTNASFLTLRFQLRAKHKLSEDDVNKLTQYLPAAFKQKKIICDRISWVSHIPRRDPSIEFQKVVGSVMAGSKAGRRWSSVLKDLGKRPSTPVEAVLETPPASAERSPVTSPLTEPIVCGENVAEPQQLIGDEGQF